MMSNKRHILSLLLISIMVCTLLSGCMGQVSEITIKEDGSGSIKLSQGMTKEALDMLNSMSKTNDSPSESRLPDDMTTFVYNNVTYYGSVDEALFENLEELNSFLTPNEDGAGEDIDTGYIEVSKNSDGSLRLELKASSDFGKTENYEASLQTESQLSAEEVQELMKGMAIVFEFNFPGNVKQVEGPTDGIKIEGSKLILDLLKMGEKVTQNTTYIFTTGVVDISEDSKISNKDGIVLSKIVFKDIPSNHWAYESIMACVQHGAIQGTTAPDAEGKGTFSPDKTVTLGEFLAVITRLISPDKIQGDVGVHWAVPNYNAAIQSNIIRGSDFESTPASLNSNLSREDMAYILVNAARVNGETLESIPDVNLLMSDYNSIDPSRQDSVKRAYSNGLLMGDNQGKFNPHNTMTRAQMATVVCRLMEYAPRDATPTPLPQVENKYTVSEAGDTQGMLRPTYSRQYEIQALQSVRTGEDSKGVYVTFTAPTLPTEIQNDFTFNFNAAVTKPNGDYFADRIRVNLKSGESKTVYFVSYQDTGVKSSQIGDMHIGVAIENSEGKSMFTRSIENNDKSNSYGTWHNGLDDTIKLDSSAVWQGIKK